MDEKSRWWRLGWWGHGKREKKGRWGGWVRPRKRVGSDAGGVARWKGDGIARSHEDTDLVGTGNPITS